MTDKTEVKIPFDTYWFRIKEATWEISKKNGNKMFKLITELVETPPLNVDGEEVDVNGLEPKPTYIAPVMESHPGGTHLVTTKCLNNVNNFRQNLRPPLDRITAEDVVNIEPAHFVGRKFVATASTKQGTLKNPETGQDVINKLDGKPIQTFTFEVGRIQGTSGQ